MGHGTTTLAAGLAAAALVLGDGGLAAAQQPAPKTSSLSWARLEGADTCIGAGALARRVERLLGRSVFVSPAHAELSIDGQVVPTATHGWKASLSLSDREGHPLGQRALGSDEPSCRTLDEPVALAIALMIDPDAALGGEDGATGAPAPAGPPQEPRVIVRERPVYVPVPAPARPPPAPPWRVTVRGGPALGFGLLPGPAVGAQAGVSVQPPWLPISIDGSAAAFLPTEGSAEGASGDFQIAYVRLALCPLPATPLGPLRLSVCIGIELGRLWADGTDAGGGGWEQHQFVANIATTARLAYRIWGPLTASVGLSGAALLVRDSFAATGSSGQPREIFRPGPLTARPDLALELRFP